jgi:3-oxoacyl-ACP reductase-like protein
VELSPRQRSAVFAGIVIVLAALGYYLVVPALTRSHAPAAAASGSAPATGSAAAPNSAGAPAPAVTASAADASGPNIYAWLPFTQQDLAAAASVAVRFSIDYNTFTYTESAADYVGAMGGLITGQLATTLQAAYQVPGVAQLRTSQKQVSTGTAVINSLRAFGPSSMTFIVTAGQRLATANGTSSGSTQYAVTVTGSGSSWQVSDIELESAGNS